MASPRSLCPCQSTRIFSPEGLTTSAITNRTSASAPMGVACPAVSQMQMARAPQSIAVAYRRFTVSGSQRLVSSVTNITSSPSDTAYFTAFSVVCKRKSSDHPSVKRRIGLEPIKVAASMGSPVVCTISAIGRMSFSWVRAAQLARIFIFCATISRASAVTASTARAPAPGSPRSRESIPSASMRWRISIFSGIDGSRTEGDCNPSRRLSSLSSTGPGGFSPGG